MREVAFDESGNTGQNLLDPVQPVYVLASVDVREEMAGQVAAMVRGTDFDELKFSEMRIDSTGRKILAEVFGSGVIDGSNARAVPVEKEWMVAGKMVDLLWEPGVTDSGGFYASGTHRKIADALFHQGPKEAGAEIWRRLQESFVAAVRSPRNEALTAELGIALAAAKEAAAGTPVGILLEVVPQDPETLGELIPHGADELDPALGGLVEQLHHWSQRLGEPFRVLHDDSGVVERWAELLERLSDQAMPARSFELGEARFVFPLQAPRIEVTVSEGSAGVQLADVLSGAVTWCLREKVLGKEVPEEWWQWGLARFIEFAQGPPDFLAGLVE